MLNFGLGELRLVDPQCDHLSDAAKARASGGALVLERAKVYATLALATADLSKTFATTARMRGVTCSLVTPEEMAQRIMSSVMENEENQAAKCGIMYARPRKIKQHI